MHHLQILRKSFAICKVNVIHNSNSIKNNKYVCTGESIIRNLFKLFRKQIFYSGNGSHYRNSIKTLNASALGVPRNAN